MVSTQGSERALLAFLLAKLQELDADVYTGHNISGFDIDVLLHRLQAHKVGKLPCLLEWEPPFNPSAQACPSIALDSVDFQLL